MDETSVGGEKVERKAGGGRAAARGAPAGGDPPREDTKNQSPATDRKALRALRFGRREWLWRQRLRDGAMPRVPTDLHGLAKRLAGCGRAKVGDDTPLGRELARHGAGGSVVVRKHGDGSASFAGVMLCGMGWTCPVCAATIAAGRAVEVDTAVTRWLQGRRVLDDDEVERREGGGNTLLFGTFTIPHAGELGRDLPALLNALRDAWSKVAGGGKAWEDDRRGFGIAGWIRTVEVTIGRPNGWHPHMHVVFFVRGEMTKKQLAELRANLARRWARGVEQAGFPTPDEVRGVVITKYVPNEKGAADLARYLSKVGDTKAGTWVGDELTRGDMKKARRGRLSPFELLDVVQNRSANGERRAWARRSWWEYAEATRGRARIRWSRGLRDLLDIAEVDDRTLLEMQQDEDAARVVETVLIPYDVWLDSVCSTPGMLARILDAMETDGAAAVIALVPRSRAGPDDLTGPSPF